MPSYTERLRVPASWWVLGMVSAATFATTAWAGFSLWLALASYLVFCGGCAGALLLWSRTAVVVADGELRVGRARLRLTEVGAVTALDPAQTRAMRGPRADPAARLLLRPYLRQAVYVQVAGPVPYWLIGTRRPAELATAIKNATVGTHR
jgi:Protein of unknown function (DUF3093)